MYPSIITFISIKNYIFVRAEFFFIGIVYKKKSYLASVQQ